MAQDGDGVWSSDVYTTRRKHKVNDVVALEHGRPSFVDATNATTEEGYNR